MGWRRITYQRTRTNWRYCCCFERSFFLEPWSGSNFSGDSSNLMFGHNLFSNSISVFANPTKDFIFSIFRWSVSDHGSTWSPLYFFRCIWHLCMKIDINYLLVLKIRSKRYAYNLIFFLKFKTMNINSLEIGMDW